MFDAMGEEGRMSLRSMACMEAGLFRISMVSVGAAESVRSELDQMKFTVNHLQLTCWPIFRKLLLPQEETITLSDVTSSCTNNAEKNNLILYWTVTR